jgi:hypothetical protein
MNTCKTRLTFLSRFVVIGLCVAKLFHLTMHYVFSAPTPWKSFFIIKSARFNDWTDTVASAASHDPYFKHGPTIANYFPFTYFLCLPAVPLTKDASVDLFLLVALGLLAVALIVYYRLYLRQALGKPSFCNFIALVLAIGCSYPWIFALDRGNLESWVSILSLIFVLLRHNRFFWLGALALSIGIAIKAYPVVFLILLVSERRYGAAAAIVAMALALTLTSMLGLDGSLIHMIHGVQTGLQEYYEGWILGPTTVNYSTDPYNGLRLFTGWIRYVPGNALIITNSPLYVKTYVCFSSAFAMAGTAFVLFVPAPRWRHIMAICLVALLYPTAANDYKLLTLFPGLFMLLIAPESGRREALALWCMALLMVPKQYYYIVNYYTISTLISPVLVLVLAGLVLVDGPVWREGMNGFYAKMRWYLAGLRFKS